MALSFRDCHTKIRHVDAHATLNEGVVVQVMGELSNNMQPMRKFMQTFVLAPEVSGRHAASRVDVASLWFSETREGNVDSRIRSTFSNSRSVDETQGLRSIQIHSGLLKLDVGFAQVYFLL